MNLDPKKKLSLIIILFLFLIGAFFFVWKIFSNRASILVTAKAPYTLTLFRVGSENSSQTAAQLPYQERLCDTALCTLAIVPGNYTLLIAKENYRTESRKIILSPNGRYEEKIEFIFLPSISDQRQRKIFTLPEWARIFQTNLSAISLDIEQLPTGELKNIPQKVSNIVFGPDGKTALVFQENQISLYSTGSATLTKIPLSPETKIFYNSAGTAILYIARNSITLRQSLFRQEITDQGELRDQIMLTSFIRDILDYSITVSSGDHNLILIDQGATQVTLYHIDLQTKTRTNIFTAPSIVGAKWFPDGKDFLFETRDFEVPNSFIYHYAFDTKTLKKLDLRVPLKNIVPVDQSRLIAATIEYIPSSAKIEDMEGKIVEPSIAPKAMMTEEQRLKNDELPMLAFIDYALLQNQGRLITGILNQTIPETMQLSRDKSKLYFLLENKVFTLHFQP